MTDTRIAARPGGLRLRPAPDGLPDPNVQPPTIAESGDPFAALRILHLVARVERRRPVRLGDLVDQLNVTYLDWLFTQATVADALLQLQVNWMSDYRNSSGIVLEDDVYGPTLTIEDTSRVDPWLVRQVQRKAVECARRLMEFSLNESSTGDG